MFRMSHAVAGGSALIALSVLPAQGQDLDPLMTQVLELSKTHSIDDWAYTQNMNINAMGEADVEIISRYDPSKPKDEQVELISITVNGDREDEDSDDMDYSDMEIPSYSDLEDLIEGGVELIKEDEKTATYRVFPSEDGHQFDFGSLDIDTNDADENLMGELVVQKGDTPYVSDVRFYLDKPYGSVWLAKVKELNFGYSFAPQGDGTILADKFHLDLDLKTLLFVHVEVGIDTEFTDFTFVGSK